MCCINILPVHRPKPIDKVGDGSQRKTGEEAMCVEFSLKPFADLKSSN